MVACFRRGLADFSGLFGVRAGFSFNLENASRMMLHKRCLWVSLAAFNGVVFPAKQSARMFSWASIVERLVEGLVVESWWWPHTHY